VIEQLKPNSRRINHNAANPQPDHLKPDSRQKKSHPKVAFH